MAVIPFYGTDEPELFAIERRAMDRPGRVIDRLDQLLGATGLVVDIGAGDGFTAARLDRADRPVVAVEPSMSMIRSGGRDDLRWVAGDAEQLPFARASFTSAYSTWAYFFTRGWDPTPGLEELNRVVVPGGPILIVDNMGGDEFTSLASTDITADPEFWRNRGYDCETIDTVFRFDDIDEARLLLGRYFGERGVERAAVEVSYRVGIFKGTSSGSI